MSPYEITLKITDEDRQRMKFDWEGYDMAAFIANLLKPYFPSVESKCTGTAQYDEHEAA